MLYHYSLGFPPEAETDLGLIRLIYTLHAMREARADGLPYLPEFLDTRHEQVVPIELEINQGVTTKVVYRVARFRGRQDLIMVIVPQTRRVKTVWVQRFDDRHATLDTSRYQRLGGICVG